MARILIADDEPYILRSLTFVLRHDGHDVDNANNGTAALEALLTETFDIAFLDIMMPGHSGFDVLRKFQAERADAHTKIIFLTAKGMSEDRKQGLEMGASEFLSKPFSPMEISKLVTRLCQEDDQERASS